MTNNISHKSTDEDHIAAIFHILHHELHLYPELYAEAAPQPQRENVIVLSVEESKKPRRRRKRSKKEGESGRKKRKLSAEQVNALELSFGHERKLESQRKDKIALELGLDPRQVAVWFQNQRARWKTKKIQEDYNKLKTSHDSIVVEKYRLESEVLKLKEELSKAAKEVEELSRSVQSASISIIDNNYSPTTSSVSNIDQATIDPPFLGEFVTDHIYEDMFYNMPRSNYIHGIEWTNFYV